jgi:hypothetical protein
VDYEVWNPATDEHLAAHYDTNDLSGKSFASSICYAPSACPKKIWSVPSSRQCRA